MSLCCVTRTAKCIGLYPDSAFSFINTDMHYFNLQEVDFKAVAEKSLSAGKTPLIKKKENVCKTELCFLST